MVKMTREEFDRLKALTGSDDVLLDGKPMEDDPAPTNFIFERAFVGKDDDGAYVPLAILGGELAQLATKVFEDPVVVAYTFATIISRGETFRTADARAVQAVRKFLELESSGRARVGVEL
jgi:hypothetical protein